MRAFFCTWRVVFQKILLYQQIQSWCILNTKLQQCMLNIGSFYVSNTVEHLLLLFQFAESLVPQVIFHCTEKGTGCNVADSPAELQHAMNSMFVRCDVSLLAKRNSFWHLFKIQYVKTCNMLNQIVWMPINSNCKYQQALHSLLSHETVCAVTSNVGQVS